MVLYICTARSINGCPAARSHAEQAHSAQRELNLEEMDYLSFSFLLILCLALLGMLTSACNSLGQLQSCTRLQQRYICLQDIYCKCLPTAQSLAGAGPLYLADTAWPAVTESPEVTDCTPALRSPHCIAEVKLFQNSLTLDLFAWRVCGCLQAQCRAKILASRESSPWPAVDLFAWRMRSS